MNESNLTNINLQLRGNDIFGQGNGGAFTESIAKDGLPYATLSYANGPGYEKHTKAAGGRIDVSTMNVTANVSFAYTYITIYYSSVYPLNKLPFLFIKYV